MSKSFQKRHESFHRQKDELSMNFLNSDFRLSMEVKEIFET